MKKNIKEIYNEALPKKVSKPYYELYKLLLKVRRNFDNIIYNDMQSSNMKERYNKLISKKERLLKDLDDAKNREKLLSTYEEEYYVIKERPLSNLESQKIEVLLNSKKDLVVELRDIFSKLKRINEDSKLIDKSILEYESNIEILRQQLAQNINDIKSLLETMELNNLTPTRVDNLKITDKHLDEIYEYIMEDYKDNKKLPDYKINNLIYFIFKNNFELERKLMKEIYFASIKCIEEYNKRREINFKKENEIDTIINIGILDVLDNIIPSTLGEFGKDYLSECCEISKHILNIMNDNYDRETLKKLENIYSKSSNMYTNLNTELFSSYVFAQYIDKKNEPKKKKLS